MGGGQRPEPGVNGNWECEECKNVNFPRRWACYTIHSGVHLLYLKHNREKMAEQREHGGNFHYECRLHGGNPSWSYLKWVRCRMRAHHGLVSVLVAHGYVTLYESLAMSFRILTRLTHPQESRIRKIREFVDWICFHLMTLLYSDMYLLWSIDDSSGEWWQLVNSIHDGGDGWYLVNELTRLLLHIFCCKSFGLTCTDQCNPHRPPCKMIFVGP